MNEILKAIKKEKYRLLIVILISLITYYLTLYPVNTVGVIIDKLDKELLTKDEFLKQIIYLLLSAISLYLVFYFKEYYIFIGEFNAQYNIGDIVLKKMYKQTSVFFSKLPISDVISIIINDVSKYISLYFSLAVLFFVEGVIYNFILTSIIWYKSNLIFTILVILPFILQTIILVLRRKKQSQDYQEMTDSMDLIVKNTLENIKGIRIVRAYNMRKIIRKNFINNIDKYSENLLKYALNFALLQPLLMLSKSFSYLVLVIYGYYLISIGETTLGNLVSISIILAMLSWPYAALSELILRTREVKEASQRTAKILDSEDIVKEDNETKFIFNDKIEFKNFNFILNSNKLLDDINLEIKKGETLAIVGKTGSGKSILAKQILRFFEIEDNQIFVDGIDIKKINVKEIRENIGYVPQDNMLFSKTIKDNILFYRNLEKNLEESIYISDLEKDILGFANGINSLVGENGLSLSGGQKQRIAIARAIISDPEILILDDALSAVDANTEKEVLTRLKEKRKNKSNIIISHRISVVKDADEILVMSQGKIVDRGKHENLIKKDGWYKELYLYQHSEEIINEK